mmetsp:Transcript_39646/g.95211  ORF Transcript_39646/g.95211 Transcript_39646/m.95211 type:complete len:282 (+) Transcript_39646:1543-2388(+)
MDTVPVQLSRRPLADDHPEGHVHGTSANRGQCTKRIDSQTPIPHAGVVRPVGQPRVRDVAHPLGASYCANEKENGGHSAGRSHVHHEDRERHAARHTLLLPDIGMDSLVQGHCGLGLRPVGRRCVLVGQVFDLLGAAGCHLFLFGVLADLVQVAGFSELRIGPVEDDVVVRHLDHPIHVGQHTLRVSHEHHCAALDQGPEQAVANHVGDDVRIQGGEHIVQNKDLGLAEYSTGQSNPLLLTAGQIDSAVPDRRLVPVRQDGQICGKGARAERRLIPPSLTV